MEDKITITQEEAIKLAEILIKPAAFAKNENKEIAQKIGVYETLKNAVSIKENAFWADSAKDEQEDKQRASNMIDGVKEKISSVLEYNGYKSPNLTQEGKESQIKEQLKGFGFNEKEIDSLIKKGLGNAETTGEKFELTIPNTEKARASLDEKGFDYEEKGEKLNLKGKLFIQEGMEIESSEKNINYLKKNDIPYFQMAENERKVFVPLQAKKVASLVALTAVAGPVGILAQIVLNQTGLLNKLLDQHKISSDQKTALQEGLTIAATQRVNGKDVKQFLYQDRDTGNIHRINMNDIRIPKNFMGVDLTPAQLEALKQGKNVEVVKNNIYYQFRVDLQETSGMKAAYKAMNYDTFKQVPTPRSSDAEKLEYIAAVGKVGVDDIYHGNGMRMERDSFLEGHNLKDRFVEIEELQKTLAKGGVDPYSAAFSMAKDEIKEKSQKFAEAAELLIFPEENIGRKR